MTLSNSELTCFVGTLSQQHSSSSPDVMQITKPSTDASSNGYAPPDELDPGVRVAVLLSNYLDSQRSFPVKEEAAELQPQQAIATATENHALAATSSPQREAEIAELSNLIWVPANKHPQIAPNEFAIWIKTHGLAQVKSTSKVRRKRSVLSMSYTSEDDMNDSDEDSLISPPDIDPLNRSSSSVSSLSLQVSDASPILFPQESRSLLRRSALSARGKIRRQSTAPTDDKEKRQARKRISAHIRSYNVDEDHMDNTNSVSSGGVTLYDRPVSMSEWIDLGNANFERDYSQHKILSRVHDAETNVLSHLSDEPINERKEEKTGLATITEEVTTPSSTLSAPTEGEIQNEKKDRRKSLRRSLSERMAFSKSEKKSSWFGALFEHKEKKNRRVDDVPDNRRQSIEKNMIALTRANSSATVAPSKKSTLVSFFARKFSSRSNPASTTTGNNPSQQPNISAMKPYIHSYRLPLHIERGIYRLSHMKLSNPRRPLREQVMISNLMFWYLSIINVQPLVQQQQQQQPSSLSSSSSSSPPSAPQHEPVVTSSPFHSSAQPHQNNTPLESTSQRNGFQPSPSDTSSLQSSKTAASQSFSQSSPQPTMSTTSTTRPKKNKKDDKYKPIPNADYRKTTTRPH
ncbi:hypothetical protein EC973_002376 [Apophysomyces ossiformis]|uniref:Protein Zds1 C-terminal domain-containing protein n=1 Tax=Apophysomyces ossiformis TaxID=679940 RepID=A0A8H7EMY5_9FUNG|nr:hypothetical protein EC973_002376 [Apophysomyces ossiformis]